MYIPQNGFVQRRAVAILTLLAMLVAPLCASTCGSHACATLSPTQSEDCHSSVTASDTAPKTNVAAIRACGLQESPAAALNEPANPSDGAKQNSAVLAPSNFVAPQSIRLLVGDACCSRPDNERFSANIFARPTILRI